MDAPNFILTFNRGSTVADVAKKVMGDAPVAYVEGAGGIRVSEDEIVEVGKHDVSSDYVSSFLFCWLTRLSFVPDTLLQSRPIGYAILTMYSFNA